MSEYHYRSDNMIAKYASIEAISNTKIGEAMNDLAEMNVGKLHLLVVTENDDPVGGIILLRGEDTARYVQAIEDTYDEIDNEIS